MTKIFRLNSFFEYELQTYPDVTIKNLVIERNHLLEKLFLLTADKSDFVMTTKKISDRMLDYWNSKNICFAKERFSAHPFGLASSSPPTRDFSEKDFYVEWGKTSVLVNLEIFYDFEKINESKKINSKIFQAELKNKYRLSDLASKVVIDFESVKSFLVEHNAPCVMKSEFGFSGKNQLLVRDKKSRDQAEALIKNSIGGKWSIEKWVGRERVFDFSGLFESSKNHIRLLAITEMLVSNSGTYRGSIVILNKKYSFEDALCDTAEIFLKNLPLNYFGPLSVDGFEYCEQGKRQIQLISEINFRYSMGRILFDLICKYSLDFKAFSLYFFHPKKISASEFERSFGLIEKKLESTILAVTPVWDDKQNLSKSIGLFICADDELILRKVFDEIEKL